ncbi:glycosyltransferase family 61 protein [Drechmeria coniospora]|uniref:EGF domain-specific O-linked N-acetylglucosamine transferase n=1 Tax=Drechmeria coniospora TaxID=98403 RepID=A0A151GV06_DRECN|nr:glycosyltransferase family 61 protein [Drechmeria coniospora]KYK60939.1 glycosyltransferase family 61 protein [Drechmeria coniospora]
MLLPSNRLHQVTAILILVLVFGFVLFQTRHSLDPVLAPVDTVLASVEPLRPSPSKPVSGRLPTDYHPLAAASETGWCQARFGTRYLEDARRFSVSYCGDGSASRVTCFMSSTAPPRVDAMCHGRNAVFDESQSQFRLACHPRPLSRAEQARGVPSSPRDLPSYWYATGPGAIVEQALRLEDGHALPAERSQRTTILLKREGISNPWHSLMEIMSLSWSLDVLQMSEDAQTGEPFVGPKAGADMQVVVVDGYDDGPYMDMWKLFAKMPIRRIQDLDASEPVSDVIIPFAGGSNPLWQGDWDDLLCRDSSLVKTFASRVFAHYNATTPVKENNKVVVTYIRRTTTRKLMDEDAHMQALRDKIPHMELVVLDFAAMPFAEQVKAVRETDLLIGVHGAGLTHLMFLQPGSAVIEILPERFQHKGFRNLAQMLGIGYFRAHTQMHGDARGPNQWQSDNVEIERKRFVDLVRFGVASLYNTGTKSYDVV